jgi:uncharacterized membrane protein YbhN (UPF0104 family)
MRSSRFDLRRLAGAALVVAAGAFLASYIARDWRELSRFDWSVDLPQLLISVLGHVAVLAWGVFVWGRVLARFEHPPVRLATLLRIWFLSNLARYIPGKVWQFVGAAQLARAAGISGPVLLTSMVVHAGFSVLAAAVVAMATLPLQGYLPVDGALAAVLVAVAALLLVHPAVLNGLLRLIPRAVHRTVLVWTGRWRDGVALLALATLSWVFYGLVFALFVDSLVAVPARALVPLTGVNALAFLAGYLVFIAPAGLGAREVALTALLAPFAPGAVPAVVAVLSRLWTVAAEALGALASLARSRGR